MSDDSTKLQATIHSGILDPSQLTDSNSAGSKAFQLKRLQELGLKVPSFLVLTPEVCETLISSPILAQQVSLQIHHKLLQNLYAVRSSAYVEDGKSFSFAGLFRTQLAVPPERLDWAIIDVLAHSVEVLAMGSIKEFAIIIQEFVEPDLSGVTFTRNPLGSPEMVMESHQGRGEKIVGGEVKPKRVSFFRSHSNEYACQFPASSRAIENFIKIEASFGWPQDIEWCVKGSEIFYLQTRPLTTLTPKDISAIEIFEKSLPASTPFIFEKTEICEIAPNPVPLTLSLLKLIYSDHGPCANVYRKHGIQFHSRDIFKVIGTELFINRELELQTLFPNFTLLKDPEREMQKWIWRPGIFRSIKNMFCLGFLLTRANETSARKLCTQLKETLSLYDGTRSGQASEGLYDFLRYYEIIFEINLLASAAQKRADVLLKKIDGLSLVQVSQFSQFFLQDIEPLEGVVSIPPLRGNGLDIADESPFVTLQPKGTVENAVPETWEKISTINKKALLPAIRSALLFVQLREMGRLLTVTMVHSLREIIRQKAQKLHLGREKMLHFATWDELLASSISLSELESRCEKYEMERPFSFPTKISDHIVERPDELGLCVSPGSCEGTLIFLDELEKIEDTTNAGERFILVTQMLRPDIARYFPVLVGIISEKGGLLSHLSILAREAGIPVLTQRSVAGKFHSGQRVRLDSSSGLVELLTAFKVESNRD